MPSALPAPPGAARLASRRASRETPAPVTARVPGALARTAARGRVVVPPRASSSSSSDHPFLSDAAGVAAADAAAAALRTPHAGYHFDGTPRRFFEGWYWKVRRKREGKGKRERERVFLGCKKNSSNIQNKKKRWTSPARPATRSP
jgi:hypothetical protein